jgi:putative colanic acid biosynthesis glycosyltransferase
VIKILQVNTTYNKGGAAQIANGIHNYLNSINGFESYFAYGRGKKSEDKRSIRFTYRFEILINLFITRFMGLHGFGTFFSTGKLKKYIIKNNFDVIHLHNIHGYYVDLNLINFFKKINKPVVWTLHDAWSVLGRNNKILGGSEKFIYPKSYIDLSTVMWKIKKKIFCDLSNFIIITPSVWLNNIVKDSILKKNNSRIIYNAIDCNIFKPMDRVNLKNKYNIMANKKIVLFSAGDLNNRQKGFEYFIRAINRILNQDLLILTIGKRYKPRLYCRHDLINMGVIRDKKMLAELFNISDLYCTTSLDEAFGLTVTEAMACGIPVAGFKTGGIIEQVGAECGILVRQKDERSLALGINKLLTDAKFYKSCRRNGLIKVKKNYTMQSFYKNYLTLYSKLIKK